MPKGVASSRASRDPGGNITGLTSINTELNGKRLELLKEIIPKLSQVGYLWSSTNPDAGYDDERDRDCGSVFRVRDSILRGERA